MREVLNRYTTPKQISDGTTTFDILATNRNIVSNMCSFTVLYIGRKKVENMVKYMLIGYTYGMLREQCLSVLEGLLGSSPH